MSVCSEENAMTLSLRQTLIELFVIGLSSGFVTVPAVAQSLEVRHARARSLRGRPVIKKGTCSSAR